MPNFPKMSVVSLVCDLAKYVNDCDEFKARTIRTFAENSKSIERIVRDLKTTPIENITISPVVIFFAVVYNIQPILDVVFLTENMTLQSILLYLRVGSHAKDVMDGLMAEVL